MIDCKPAPPSIWTDIWQNVYSQFGEDGIIAEIFRRIGTTNKQCFEVGAADGKWFSNSRKLIDEGWSACLIEADPKNWPELDKLDAPPRVNVVHGKAEPDGPNSLDSILTQCGFDASPDLGIIDVDGQDYYLWNGMRFRPRVMVVEYDRFVDEGYIPDRNGAGQAGLAAICSIAVSKGYCNVAATPTNAVFVLLSEKAKFFADGADKPARVDRIGEIASCDSCAEEIQWTGSEWKHTKSNPRHMAYPRRITNAQAIIADATAELEKKKAALTPPLPIPMLATGKEQEIKIAAILSRPRFGLNVFFDFASQALAPWHIPLQSFYSVFWEQGMTKGMEDAIANGVDWVLSLDFDSAFTSKHIQQLIDALAQNPAIDAIAPLQIRRGRPLPLAVRVDGKMPLTGAPVQVVTAHFGLTIFRVDAIKRMKKPWFLAVPDASGGWGEGRLDPDIYFWGNWRDNGNTVYVHSGCRIGHIEEFVSDYGPDSNPRHSYLSTWRKEHGHQIESLE